MTEKEFHSIVNEQSDFMYRLALYNSVNEENAKDIVQDCLINLWKENKPLDSYNNIKAYCSVLVRNRCIDHHRSNKTKLKLKKEIVLNDNENEIDKQHERQERLSRMYFFLKKMNPTQAELLFYRDFENYSYEEISKSMKLSLEQVKVGLFRARKKLKEIMKTEHETRKVTY